MGVGMIGDIFGSDGLILLVVVGVVLLFGGAQLPKLARGLGSASHEFKKGVAEGESDEATMKKKVTQPPTTTVD